ncbi:hypothetical protein CHCC20488_1510 [Bacillus paralicheniformis]|nr:hypothetical protein CHCC20497_1320 [Bacillus paralicheniformis]TWN41657.1 hypothetical protein CHCC14523_0711 [Bacillus paralicheniformis]TWN89138.1 hypothetical protein CHCC20492_1928 [Bacillus paralicheniformis]TWN99722.1 hypothetical protein CHCC20488_1510 [Bacillus paralicheniformis]
MFFSPYLNKVREHKTDIVFYSFFRQLLFESDLFRLICFFGYQTSVHSPNSLTAGSMHEHFSSPPGRYVLRLQRYEGSLNRLNFLS